MKPTFLQTLLPCVGVEPKSLQHQGLFGNYGCTQGEFGPFNVIRMSWKVNAILGEEKEYDE